MMLLTPRASGEVFTYHLPIVLSYRDGNKDSRSWYIHRCAYAAFWSYPFFRYWPLLFCQQLTSNVRFSQFSSMTIPHDDY